MSAVGALRLRRAELLLLGAAAIAIFWETLTAGEDLRTPAWHLPPALAVGGALIAGRRYAETVRPAVVAGLAALLYLGFFGVHRRLGLPLPDNDIFQVYPRYGHELLDTGNLPHAEYPPGALLVFAAATALGRVYVSLPLLTLPLLIAAWWVLGSCRPRAAWIVACVALWPTLEFFWEVKFDAIPTALFVLGMVAAYRERWGWAGLAFGFGAAVKWWPALAAITLAAALVRRRQIRSLAVLAGTSMIGPLLVYLPFIGAAEVTPYRSQGSRGLTGEALPFLPLHLAGLVGRPQNPWDAASAPGWTKVVATVVLAAGLAVVVYAAWRLPRHALPLAAVATVTFFLLNRIFSAQFMLPIAAAWACALVLGGDGPSPRGGRWFVLLLGVAATANYAVYPLESGHWILAEWVQFAAATGATYLVLAEAGMSLRRPRRRRVSAAVR